MAFPSEAEVTLSLVWTIEFIQIVLVLNLCFFIVIVILVGFPTF